MMETATSGTDVRVGGRSSRRGRNQHLHADMPSAKLRRSPRKRPPAESGHKQYMKAFALFGLLLVAALFIAPMQSRADAASPAARLKTDGDAYTLVELTDLALRRNPKTSLAWAAIRSSEAGVELARAGYWPAIDAALSAQRNRALNFSGLPSGTRGQLAAAIGDSPDTPFTLAAWEQEPTPMLPSRAVNDLIADARDARPDLLAAKARGVEKGEEKTKKKKK